MNDAAPPPSPERRSRLRWIILAVLAVALAGWWLRRPKSETPETGLTFEARRGPLDIIVTESGSLEAVESQEVRSEVKGWEGRKILSIVEEGYLITDDDVRTNKILIELDSSEIKQRVVTQEIEFESKQAALTEAQQGFAIQLNQNVTDLKAAEQKARFARLDAEKYLGGQVADELVKKLKLAEIEAEATRDEPVAPPPSPGAESLNPNSNAGSANVPASSAAADAARVLTLVAPPGGGAVPGTIMPANAPTPSPAPAETDPADAPLQLPKVSLASLVDFSAYAKVELLGDGEGQQKLREARDTLLIAEKERAAAQTKLEGTQRLHERGFVTKTELDAAKLELEQVVLKVQKASTSLTLFTRYEFAKQAEELLGKYEEALRNLARTRKEGMSKLAQARAKLKAAESQFSVVKKERGDLQEQLEKCTMRAIKPGLVTYGGQRDGFYYGEERIRVGATVRERQPIITIPDLTKMAVEVKVHEAQVKRVKKTMKARIRVDAFPERQLTGEVVKVGVLPDAENRWMNPDLKVYSTKVHIDGAHDWLKPGMTAKVEIQVDRLEDVVFVPIQAVAPGEKEQACNVLRGGKVERRVVQVGDYNDEFIQIKEGLQPGDIVLLRRPDEPENRGAGAPAAPESAKPATPTPTAAATPGAKA
ncbi:MAG: HlyD family efflux transporter periplasmic adaptor subunit [Verrucomicrobiales bacterium]|nr:HlyD family efflux transporter periplasmic adaptor subunit [Verrucomicrobiales bacterium]